MKQVVVESGGLIVFVVIGVKGCGAVVAYQATLRPPRSDGLVNEASCHVAHLLYLF